MKDPVAIKLKDINQWEIKFIKEVINTNIGAEVTPIAIIIICPLIGDIAISERRLRKTDITAEIYSLGGKQAVQEPDK